MIARIWVVALAAKALDAGVERFAVGGRGPEGSPVVSEGAKTTGSTRLTCFKSKLKLG
jgi:hypothetical protein